MTPFGRAMRRTSLAASLTAFALCGDDVHLARPTRELHRDRSARLSRAAPLGRPSGLPRTALFRALARSAFGGLPGRLGLALALARLSRSSSLCGLAGLRLPCCFSGRLGACFARLPSSFDATGLLDLGLRQPARLAMPTLALFLRHRNLRRLSPARSRFRCALVYSSTLFSTCQIRSSFVEDRRARRMLFLLISSLIKTV